MRITNRMMVDNAIQRMADSREKVSQLQDKLSTMKQFQNASEDPARASASLSLRSNLRTLESYMDTASGTKNWMSANDYAFSQLEDISVRANALILKGLNDTLSGPERASTLGVEMQDLLKQAIEIGNTNVNGQYIFSGYQVNTKAFTLTDQLDAGGAPVVLTDSNGKPYTPKVITYTGDQGNMQRSLGPEQSVTLNVRGDQAIQGFLQSLKLASDALMQDKTHNTGDPLTDPFTLQTTLTGLQSSLNVLDQHRTSNGARMRQVESAANFLETVNIETKSLLSEKEDTNMAEGIALLSNQKTTYEAVLQVSQRAISALSLFDYLQ
jgi:flagellar hook-associated protein 3 FlgL